jgi:two-component system, sensor histidine kinase PdtaS
MSKINHWFQRLSTTGKLLLLLSAAILPLGLVLVVAATSGINQANQAMEDRAGDRARLAMRAVDGLVARNVLALRVAANAALDGQPDPCTRAARALSLAPDVPSSFVLRDRVGTLLCSRGEPRPEERPTLLVAPGQVRLWISPSRNVIYFRVGVFGGSATGSVDREQLRTALSFAASGMNSFTLSDGNGSIRIEGLSAAQTGGRLMHSSLVVEHPIAGAQLQARAVVSTERIPSVDQLIIFLPVAMWILAALLSWLAVRTFLLGPLKRMSSAILAHDPGTGPLKLPERLGSAVEIRELGESFARAVERIERSERDMAEALEGQRKLVREVHHRVKNNLQVVASLLNIHRRSATSDDAKDAYSSIGRRVDALAVVHRNHYAELEEQRGIALRPLLSELAANLRGSAPEGGRMLDITLDLESLNTTQDVAVATAFLTTEIVEHAMLSRPDAPVTLTLRRTGDLTARFTLSTGALSEELAGKPEHQQFERIVAGLAKQLRSALDKAPGRYSVDLPVFPAG